MEIVYGFPGELNSRFWTANVIYVKDKVQHKDQKKNFHHSGKLWNLQFYVRPSSRVHAHIVVVLARVPDCPIVILMHLSTQHSYADTHNSQNTALMLHPYGVATQEQNWAWWDSFCKIYILNLLSSLKARPIYISYLNPTFEPIYILYIEIFWDRASSIMSSVSTFIVSTLGLTLGPHPKQQLSLWQKCCYH